MKKALFVAVVCTMAAGPLLAGPPEVTMYTRGLSNYRSGSGGEFTALILEPTEWKAVLGFDVLGLYADSTKNRAGYSPSFQTFCVETNEYISNGEIHTVTFEPYAVVGGSGGPRPDPISQGTAFLYEQFAKGLLSEEALDVVYNYTPSGSRATFAKLLQEAFWTLEEESGYGVSDISANIQSLLASEFNTGTGADADLAEWRKNNNGKYGVAVMNLHSELAQSQLILVPVPGAVLLGFLGLGYAGMKLRKMV